MDKKQLFKQIVEQNDNIVFFGGAGVSTEIVTKTHTKKGWDFDEYIRQIRKTIACRRDNRR